MAYKNDKKKDPSKEGIFTKSESEKATEKKIVKKAHVQEKDKLKSGFTYVQIDAKTRVLRKI